MTALKYLVPALAVVGRAAAQCSASTTTIQNAGDATALARCSTFTGDIAIATGTTDNIALDGIREIRGSLIANNATNLPQISSSTLETITDSFALSSLIILSTLNMPRLTNVEVIDWEALPALQGLSFTTGIQQASRVSIQNTQLNSLTGITLNRIDELVLTNNNYLQLVDLALGNVSTRLVLQGNGNNLTVNFPNLVWAFNMTLSNISSLSMPALQSLNGSLGFYSNTFDTVGAANLTEVRGSLSFVDNEALTNITMPKLTQVGGGFQIAKNPELDTINGFPVLRTIGGALDFNGNFSDVELPALGDVKGAFNMQSTGDLTEECNGFRRLSGQNNVIKGKFTCAGAQRNPGGAGTNPTGTSTGSSPSATGSSAASAVEISSSAVGIFGVLAVMFGLF